MNIEYIYKKEHQEVMDKIQLRIDELTDRSIKDKESYYRAASKTYSEAISVGCTFIAIEYTEPHEISYLKEQLTYLKSCLAPVTIKIIEEEEVVV